MGIIRFQNDTGFQKCAVLCVVFSLSFVVNVVVSTLFWISCGHCLNFPQAGRFQVVGFDVVYCGQAAQVCAGAGISIRQCCIWDYPVYYGWPMIFSLTITNKEVLLILPFTPIYFCTRGFSDVRITLFFKISSHVPDSTTGVNKYDHWHFPPRCFRHNWGHSRMIVAEQPHLFL